MERFIGAWRLVSYEVRRRDGERVYPYGREATGQLMYTADGHMSAIIMQADRPLIETEALYLRPDTVKDAAVRDAFKGFLAYCGTYEVDDDLKTVTHHVTEVLISGDIGNDNVRTFRFVDDELHLEAENPNVRASLIWKRAESAGGSD